ncbi:hypothetical protein COV88_00900 [Candidatus Saccharibacteria bacterium CG11_big_fil_rev_8_21_14_0_20_41_19]|nr:hypothetical protein [Candidatus Saccharibacteria bacterium]OIP86218.1 MAG: hypothetical protein AUK57_00375 [Candidatus Saccharibacteria bacterium CG2_30_41_52]PIQ71030.1 MAG: hypothetical protein COV88_00900 [Candidatus Saccharibacteria bacterium CG11_big_fil_rev_8_21_14_0_20_41_19]PIZ59435.1 MAG: hypothetical protein COY18_03550 [Candidatus Saccharibacteria bacterium CG_4_10_14_0_2_um_filter_41_11]PJC29388.1 MAG: hypothetical protein CO052_03655 [Candidatus Saccharibacteria bacterium CG_4
MEKASKVCYAYSRIEIVVAERGLDQKVQKALKGLAVIPCYVDYDEKIEAQAYSRFVKKYDEVKARAYAHFCAMVLGYTLYDGNNLRWAMQEAEARI